VPISVSGNAAHDATVNAAEAARQVAYAAAGHSMAAIKTADLVFHRAAKASAIAHGIQPGIWIEALMELTGSGV
jgi:hypothetical protein